MRISRGRIRVDKTTHVTVKLDRDVSTVPAVCPLCRSVMRSWDDEVAWNELGCCDACAQKWARQNKEHWIAGWRPEPEEVQCAVRDRPRLFLAQ